MIGRFTSIQGDTAGIDDAIALVRDTILPHVDGLPGSHGLGMWVNRETGDVLVLSVWDSLAALEESEAAITPDREKAAALLGATAKVERFEPILVDQARANRPGDIMRLLRLQGDPSREAETTAFGRDTVVPILRAQPGYVSYVAAVNRITGAGVVHSTFDSKATSDAAAAATASIRDSIGEQGLEITGLSVYEVAIVGIHAPNDNLSGQRPASDRESPVRT